MAGATNPSSITLLVGPVLLGALISWMLYGVLTMQLYFYYMSFSQDSILIRSTVYGCFVLDTVHTVAITFVAWDYLAGGWGQLDALRFTGWGFAIIPILSGVTAAWVQIFYAWRIFTLGKGDRKLIWNGIAIFVILISLAQGIAGIAAGVVFFSLNDIYQFAKIYGSAATWLAGSAASDVIIAISMVVLLARAKQRVVVNRTSERTLTRLIRLTVETGALTAAGAVVDLVFFLVVPLTNLHLLIALGLAKLYTNSLYASLNSRAPVFRVEERSSLRSRPSAGEIPLAPVPRPGVVHVTTVKNVSDPNSGLATKVGSQVRNYRSEDVQLSEFVSYNKGSEDGDSRFKKGGLHSDPEALRVY